MVQQGLREDGLDMGAFCTCSSRSRFLFVDGLYLLITLLLSVVFIIPVILFIEIHGRKKFGKAETSENEKDKK